MGVEDFLRLKSGNNLLRRHLTDYQKVRCGLELEPIERLKAKKRQEFTKLVGRGVQKKDTMVRENFPTPIDTLEKGRATDIIAKEVGRRRRGKNLPSLLGEASKRKILWLAKIFAHQLILSKKGEPVI